MGLQIITGGGAAQFGGGLGKGLVAGVDQEQERMRKEAEREQLATETVQYVNQALRPMIEQVGQQIPDTPERPGALDTTKVPMGKFGSVEVPSYMRPTPNQEQAQFNKIVEGYARTMRGMQHPAMIEKFGMAAAAELDRLSEARMTKSIGDSMKAAVSNGVMDDGEMQDILALHGTGPVKDLYKAFHEFKVERSEKMVNASRADRFKRSIDAEILTFAQDANTVTADPGEKAWLADQAGRLEDLRAEIEAESSFGYSEFDWDSARDRFDDIRNALNPAQERRQAERDAEFKALMDAQTAIYRNENLDAEERRAMIADIDARRKTLGLPPVEEEQRWPFGMGQDLPTRVEREGTAPGMAAAEQTASERSMAKLNPEQQARAEFFRRVQAPLDGVDFAAFDNAADIEARVSETLGAVLDGMTGGNGVTIKLKKGQSEVDAWGDAIADSIDQMAKVSPDAAEVIAGRVIAMMELADKRKAEIEGGGTAKLDRKIKAARSAPLNRTRSAFQGTD